MHTTRQQNRVQAVLHYVQGNDSLRETARKFHTHHPTLLGWVKTYRERGMAPFLSAYRRPWNRASEGLEQKVMLLKEHDPALTIRKAREVLASEGIEISVKGIWNIWKRFGFAGFEKESLTIRYTDCCSMSKEATAKLLAAELLFKQNKIKEAVDLLNSVPFLGKNDLLVQIPDRYLNLSRRVEKADLLFKRAPMPQFCESAGKLYERLKRKRRYLSALRVGQYYAMSLIWTGKPELEMKKVEEMKQLLQRKGDYYSALLLRLRFYLLLSEGISNVLFMKLKRARTIARTCRRILLKLKHQPVNFLLNLSTLFIYLEEFGEGEVLYEMQLARADEEGKRDVRTRLVKSYLRSGKYRKAERIMRLGDKRLNWDSASDPLVSKGIIALSRGKPQQTIALASDSIMRARKEELRIFIPNGIMLMAFAYRSLGEEKKAKALLRRIEPYYVKHKLKNELFVLRMFLTDRKMRGEQFRQQAPLLPRQQLLLFLKNRKYEKALDYARKKGMISYFQRYVLFFPDAVLDQLEKGGKVRGIPKALLRLPVFNAHTHTYSIRFLGDLLIYRDEKLVDHSLSPKEQSFLIYLASSQAEHVALEKVYRNFWPQSSCSARNLSHLLVRIRKALLLPTHQLYIKQGRLHFDCFFTTDYDEYQEHISRGKALARAGEWDLAKKEFLLAFSLFRGEPFRRMYDDWSDDKRLEVLFGYEEEVSEFAEELRNREDGNGAERILKRAARIITFSDEGMILSEDE